MEPIAGDDAYLFDLNGFLVLRDVLDAEEVAVLNRAFDEHAPPLGEAPMRGLFRLLEADESFRRLLDHPRVLPYLLNWVHPAVRADLVYGAEYHNGARADPLHLGGTPYNPMCSYTFQDGKPRCNLVVVAWALTDVPESAVPPGRGGFACIPGSHKANVDVAPDVRRFERNPENIVRSVPVKAGDALLFTEALTHGTLPWTWPFQRRVLFYRYAPGFMVFEDHPVASEVVEQMTPQQRQLVEPAYGRKARIDEHGRHSYEPRRPVGAPES